MTPQEVADRFTLEELREIVDGTSSETVLLSGNVALKDGTIVSFTTLSQAIAIKRGWAAPKKKVRIRR